MHVAQLLTAAVLVLSISIEAVRLPLSNLQQDIRSKLEMDVKSQLQPQQQDKASVAASAPSNSSTHQGNTTYRPGPGVEFVTLSPQDRPKQPSSTTPTPLQLQQQQGNGSSPFECGKPYAACGSAIPSGKTCPKGAGWCHPGYFCGWEMNTAEPSRCLPLPQDCGKAGRPCCPSNTDTPHTSQDDKLKRKPFCKDGSYCFYFAPMPNLNNGDMYAGNPGAYACTPVAQDCGTGPGKPCCPYQYKIDVNPPLPRIGCPGALFCNYDVTPSPSGVNNSLQPAFESGVCLANSPDCGQFGKSCCITTGGSSTGLDCGAKWNETGRRGYCADPNDLTGNSGSSSSSGRNGGGSSGSSSGRKASYKELICTACPDKAPDLASNPSKYWPC